MRTLFAASSAVVAAVALFGAGCTESTCQRAQRINFDLAEKAGRGKCPAPRSPFVEQNCEQTVRACTSEDLAHLDDAMDCFEKVQCEPFKEQEFTENVEGCRPPLNGLSVDCALAQP